MRERERVWWNDEFVRRTEGDELFGFGVYQVCRIVQRKMGTCLLSFFLSSSSFSPRALFSDQPLTLERAPDPPNRREGKGCIAGNDASLYGYGHPVQDKLASKT